LHIVRRDPSIANFIQDQLLTFPAYASAIYQSEIYLAVIGKDSGDINEAERLDKKRTHAHNAVIASLDALNQLCEKNGIPPVYDGTVSESRPFRVEIADAVLAYIYEVIDKRTR
ncbi:MAG: DUF3232 domain-containing protein, partial [Oscillospiraceae bacterium]|nr:DUF3232 domain-containing protein [Oscillospiraceae bacterium]